MTASAGQPGQANRPGLVAVDKYLLPNEVQVATVRRHPAVLIGPSAVALAGLLLAGVLSATVAHASRSALYIIWGIELILVLRLVWKAINWAVDYFVVTSARLLLTSGVFTRKVGMMPLSKVTDLSFQRSFAGRMLGYGEFIVESAGQNQAFQNIDHIPYPEHLYLLVCGMLFPESAAESTDHSDEDEDGEIRFGEDDGTIIDDTLIEDDGSGLVVEDDSTRIQRPPRRGRRIRRSRNPEDEL
ncbi:MAG: PH domain-containing protein [Streptosporangiaceae bacterium]